MGKFLTVFLISLLMSPMVRAGDYSVDISRQTQIASLKREISELEIKLAECERKNKNWRTATWIGAAGTVATGTAAIVQGVKLNKLKRKNESQSEKKSTDSKKSEETKSSETKDE